LVKKQDEGQSPIAASDSLPAPHGPDPDAALVAQFLAGNRDAFDALVRRHQAAIRRLVLRYVKSEADTKDITQIAFVRAFEKLSEFRGEATFRTWLFRIAINLALSHVRGAPADLAPIGDVAAFTTSLGTSRLVAAEVWRKVSLRLDDLPPKQRLALELRIFHDLSFEEVAAVAGFSVESAKTNFHYAVKRPARTPAGVPVKITGARHSASSSHRIDPFRGKLRNDDGSGYA
jgi:RNA polymerase sigma-70 factor (ECF subfamily)